MIVPWYDTVRTGENPTPCLEVCSMRLRSTMTSTLVRTFLDREVAIVKTSCEKWSWTVVTLGEIKTKTMLRLFQFKTQKEDTWVDCHARTCKIARNIWIQMGLPFLCEVIAESMWRAVGWACYERSNVVINTLQKKRSTDGEARDGGIPPEIISDDFGSFAIFLADSNSIFVVAKIIIFGVFKVQTHATRLYMSMCCGLFAPTQFLFECCGVLDDSR